MSLKPPPPVRSRRERMRVPSRRLTLLVAGAAAVTAGLLVTQPWSGSQRRAWATAPATPTRPSAAERTWLVRLGSWVGFVRNAAEDPDNSVVQDCGRRLKALPPAPPRLREVAALAHDTCAAEAALATDRRAAALSFETSHVARANREARESSHDLALLLSSLGRVGAPGGRTDVRYSRIATRLAGRDVTARCFSSSADWRAVANSPGRTEPLVGTLLGFAVISEDRIDLSPSVCRALDTLRPPSAPSYFQILGVEVLTHESEHLHGPDGIENEATTDCYAAQRMPTTARLLGESATTARRMATVYFRSERWDLPARYRSPQCRQGGALDLTPANGAFP
jgi:hypothetical protein